MTLSNFSTFDPRHSLENLSWISKNSALGNSSKVFEGFWFLPAPNQNETTNQSLLTRLWNMTTLPTGSRWIFLALKSGNYQSMISVTLPWEFGESVVVSQWIYCLCWLPASKACQLPRRCTLQSGCFACRAMQKAKHVYKSGIHVLNNNPKLSSFQLQYKIVRKIMVLLKEVLFTLVNIFADPSRIQTDGVLIPPWLSSQCQYL